MEAVETNLPNGKERLLDACTTRPFCASTSATGTFHSLAAAASRSARTVAPASRYLGRKSRMLVEPSVFCDPYFFSSPGACDDRHVLPVRFHLIGDDHRERGADALAHLGARADDGHRAGRVEPHVDHRLERFTGRCRGRARLFAEASGSRCR